MRRIKMVLRLLIVSILALVLHYALPQHDVVQVVGVSEPRQDFGPVNRWFFAQADSGSATFANRDVKLIRTEKKETFLLGFIPRDSTEIMVYRNEDTGLIWPPYFKFDSENLQTAALSSTNNGEWAVITHYGWRIPFFSIFPNAVSIRTVEGPDVTIIPWFNIGFFIFVAFCFGMVRAMWRQFRERSVDPLLDSAGDHLDVAQAEIAERRSGVRNWLNSWRAKDKRR